MPPDRGQAYSRRPRVKSRSVSVSVRVGATARRGNLGSRYTPIWCQLVLDSKTEHRSVGHKNLIGIDLAALIALTLKCQDVEIEIDD